MDEELCQDDVQNFQNALDGWLETVKELRSFSFTSQKNRNKIDREAWIGRLLEVRGREAQAHDQILAAIDQLCACFNGEMPGGTG